MFLRSTLMQAGAIMIYDALTPPGVSPSFIIGLIGVAILIAAVNLAIDEVKRDA